MYNKKSAKHRIVKKKYTNGGSEPFDSDIPAINQEESFTLNEQPLDESFTITNSVDDNGSLDQTIESTESNGPLDLNDLNITDQSNISNGTDETNMSFGNWENPDYSGNTTFESFLSEPSINHEIGGYKKSKSHKKRKGNKHKKTKRSNKSKKVRKHRVKKTRKIHKVNNGIKRPKVFIHP